MIGLLRQHRKPETDTCNRPAENLQRSDAAVPFDEAVSHEHSFTGNSAAFLVVPRLTENGDPPAHARHLRLDSRTLALATEYLRALGSQRADPVAQHGIIDFQALPAVVWVD